MTTYTVTAERRAGRGTPWMLRCLEHPGTLSQTRTLEQAAPLMRAAIALVADVDQADVQIELQVQLDDQIETLLTQAQADRVEAEAKTAAATDSYRRAARLLADRGTTVRDIGMILGLSHQRAHQLLNT